MKPPTCKALATLHRSYVACWWPFTTSVSPYFTVFFAWKWCHFAPWRKSCIYGNLMRCWERKHRKTSYKLLTNTFCGNIFWSLLEPTIKGLPWQHSGTFGWVCSRGFWMKYLGLTGSLNVIECHSWEVSVIDPWEALSSSQSSPMLAEGACYPRDMRWGWRW